MHALAAALKRFNDIGGSVIAWLTLPMVIGTFVVVVLRYAFDVGWIWMQESIVWMHAAAFMLASAYTLNRDEHVRVDIFYRGMSPRSKAVVNVLGACLFLLPVSIFIAAISWEYVLVSWQIREGSREAGGLPYPFVPLLKSVIILTSLLLVLQAIADLITSALMLLERDPDAAGPGVPGEKDG